VDSAMGEMGRSRKLAYLIEISLAVKKAKAKRDKFGASEELSDG